MGGYNNIHGRDEGPLPPSFGPKYPAEQKSPAVEPKITLKITRCAKMPWGKGCTLDEKDFMNITMSTTDKVGDLMRLLGLKSHFITRDMLIEITKTTGGGWSKGLVLHSLDKYQDNKLKDLGWNESRTGRDGERPSVYLWACEDFNID